MKLRRKREREIGLSIRVSRSIACSGRRLWRDRSIYPCISVYRLQWSTPLERSVYLSVYLGLSPAVVDAFGEIGLSIRVSRSIACSGRRLWRDRSIYPCISVYRLQWSTPLERSVYLSVYLGLSPAVIDAFGEIGLSIRVSRSIACSGRRLWRDRSIYPCISVYRLLWSTSLERSVYLSVYLGLSPAVVDAFGEIGLSIRVSRSIACSGRRLWQAQPRHSGLQPHLARGL